MTRMSAVLETRTGGTISQNALDMRVLRTVLERRLIMHQTGPRYFILMSNFVVGFQIRNRHPEVQFGRPHRKERQDFGEMAHASGEGTENRIHRSPGLHQFHRHLTQPSGLRLRSEDSQNRSVEPEPRTQVQQEQKHETGSTNRIAHPRVAVHKTRLQDHLGKLWQN